MKARITPPQSYELFHEDIGFKVRFDYDEGEEQWFDARAGVGSPGYPASVVITEVDFGKGWESPENYPQLNIEACEQSIMEKIDLLHESYWAEYDERMQGGRE